VSHPLAHLTRALAARCGALLCSLMGGISVYVCPTRHRGFFGEQAPAGLGSGVGGKNLVLFVAGGKLSLRYEANEVERHRPTGIC